jgi:hypothetical protein
MKHITVKFGNMRGEAQRFTIYPYNGGDTILIQSDKRIAQINLKTGATILSKQCQGGAYFMHLNDFMGAMQCEFPKDELVKLQEYLWNNVGEQKHGGILITENKELFSQK